MEEFDAGGVIAQDFGGFGTGVGGESDVKLKADSVRLCDKGCRRGLAVVEFNCELNVVVVIAKCIIVLGEAVGSASSWRAVSRVAGMLLKFSSSRYGTTSSLAPKFSICSDDLIEIAFQSRDGDMSTRDAEARVLCRTEDTSSVSASDTRYAYSMPSKPASAIR